MSKINIRSPYFITVAETDLTSAILELYIYTGTQVATMDSITYTLESDAISAVVTFEISQLISDYLDTTFDGVFDSQVVWVNYQLTHFILDSAQTPEAVVQLTAFDGYGYFEDLVNPQLSDRLLQTNTTVYVYDNNYFYIAVQQDYIDTIEIRANGGVVDSQAFTPTTASSDVIRYIGYTNSTSDCDDNINYIFEDRDNYLFEDANNFIFSGNTVVDEILITYTDAATQSISIVPIRESKYTPYRLTFINKFGALQSIWMFKRTDLALEVESDSYRSYTYSAAAYSVSSHQYRNLMVSGKETISLNTGFYVESHNEIFRQLVLSEKIWIDYEGNILPINLKSKELSFKTSLNDKLINYKLEFEFAYDKINSVY